MQPGQRTCCIAGPSRSPFFFGTVNATPGSQVRSNQPLSMAGGPCHHVG